MPEYSIGVKFGATGLEQLNKDVGSATQSLTGLSKAFVQLPKVDLSKTITGAPELKKQTDDAVKSFQALGNTFIQPPTLNVDGVVDNLRKVPPAISASVASLASYKKAVNDLRASTGAGIKVPVSVASLDQLQAKLTDIRAKLQANTNPLLFSRLAAEANKTQLAVSALEKSVGSAGRNIGGIKSGANQAGTALSNLGRVAQDAPFGFIGIQNNINPLLESFQRLKTETGSSSGALKALGSSLLGAGGVGLGLSVVTGLVTVAIQKYGSLGNAIDVVFGLTSNLEQANRDLAKSFAESAGSVAGEVALVKSLVGIASNKALSDETRQQALNKLNKEYDAYLPKLTLETIGTKEATEAINALTTSLVRQAKIKGVQDLISKETAEQAKLFAGSITENLGVVDEMVAALKNLGGLDPTARLVQGAKATGEQFKKSQERVDAFSKALNKLTGEEAVNQTLDPGFKEAKVRQQNIDLLGKQLTALEKVRNIQQKAVEVPVINKKFIGFETEGLSDKEIEELTGQRKIEKALKEVDDLIKTSQKIYDVKIKIRARDLKAGVIDQETADGLKKQAEADLDKAFLAKALLFEGTIRVKPTVTVDRADTTPAEIVSSIAKATGLDKTIQVPTQFQINVKFLGVEAAQAIEDANARIEAFKAEIAEIAESSLENSIGAIGEGLGNLISGEGITNVVGPLINAIGDALIALGKAAIKAGVTMQALKKAMAALKEHPVLAIAIGITAIAAGTALKNKFNNTTMPKFANGGIANGPLSGYGVELHGREMIIPLDKVNNAPNFSSKDGFNVLPSVNFSGDMFRIMLNKVDRRKRRV